jgi:hypothetical protein
MSNPFSSAAAVLLLSTCPLHAQETLTGQTAVGASVAEKQCMTLPAASVEERIEVPHSGSLLRARCEVVEFRRLNARWSAALYRWTLEFAQGAASEEEAVLFEALDAQRLRPEWHARYETGAFADWRSVAPEVSVNAQRVLLSVTRCVNGTGGCSQEFLVRRPGGQWAEVTQAWLNQLPEGFNRRMYKGFVIDPDTLRGEAGFYSDGDANCCPSEQISFEVRLEGEAMRLVNYRVAKQP